jgi:hypothetical protein
VVRAPGVTRETYECGDGVLAQRADPGLRFGLAIVFVYNVYWCRHVWSPCWLTLSYGDKTDRPRNDYLQNAYIKDLHGLAIGASLVVVADFFAFRCCCPGCCVDVVIILWVVSERDTDVVPSDTPNVAMHVLKAPTWKNLSDAVFGSSSAASVRVHH